MTPKAGSTTSSFQRSIGGTSRTRSAAEHSSKPCAKAFRQGPDAFAWEQIDVFLPWGFRLAEIAIEVHVFHGEQDAWVARRHVDFLVDTLRSARLVVWPRCEARRRA
jgi:pimeloyl-ACP methyl ester carboxylesterase